MRIASNVLVTGATGYIGAFLIPRLVAEGHIVKVVSRSPIIVAEEFEQHVVPVVGELLDTGMLISAMQGVDVVYHLAGFGSPATPAVKDSELFGTNITCTQAVLRAATTAGVRRVIFTSSAAVYGEVQDDPKREDMALIPSSPYAVSKIAAEHLFSMFHRQGAFESVILRIFNVYGPAQDKFGHGEMFIPKTVRSIREGAVLRLRGEGLQTRDYIHVEDVVEGLMRAGFRASVSGMTINLGTGAGVPIRAVIDTLSQKLGVAPQTISEPLLKSEVMQATADVLTMNNALGTWPMVKLSAGLEHVVDESLNSTCHRWWSRPVR